ncbi:MAG: serine/threonine-protein phosphatase [Spirochaetaceae bacterium]
MNNFYLFTFIVVIVLGFNMTLDIKNKREYGDRWKYLLISSILFVLIGGITTFITIRPLTNVKLYAPIFIVVALLYSLALLFLEVSVHAQRIKLSFLTDDVNNSLKKYKLFIIISAISVLIFFVGVILNTKINMLTLLIVSISSLAVANFQILASVFNFRKGVLRKKNYPFVVLLIFMTYGLFLVVISYTGDKPIQFSTLIILNLIFIIRSYEEYVYFRTKHMQFMLNNQNKIRKENGKLINKVILSSAEEDSEIIVNLTKGMLANMKRDLVMESYGITGIVTFRLYNGVFKIDHDDMIMGYCTPLEPVISIKKISHDNIHKKLSETKFNLDYILETPISEMKNFGEKYLKLIIEKKEIIEMDDIPTCFNGLQKCISFVPIFNEDRIAGFQVVFKDKYSQLYYFEKKMLKNQGYTLNTVFSIINGKQIQEDRNRLIGEMNIAKDIQTSIVPKSIELDGYSVACDMVTATEVGGDAYDFVTNKFGNYFSIGDVSGHGLPSGITALIFLASIHAALDASEVLDKQLDPDKVYDIVNRVLCKINRDRIGSDKFMTGNILREEDGVLHYAGAHEVAIQYCKKNNEVILHRGFTEKTAFLGLSEYIKSETSKGSLTLESGDILVLYTDGVIEAKDENAVQYGVENVEALLFENCDSEPGVILDLIKGEVMSYAKKGDIKQNGGNLSDDISMVIIKKN